MIRYIAVYQGQYPTDSGPREAFALHDTATILGYHVLLAANLRKSGTVYFGANYHDGLLRHRAEEEVHGYFRTAIEPNGNSLELNVYEGSGIHPIQSASYPDVNTAIASGRKRLAELVANCTVSDLL